LQLFSLFSRYSSVVFCLASALFSSVIYLSSTCSSLLEWLSTAFLLP
jgi:hypothetical protein